MTNTRERICCQATSEIIFISLTDGSRNVCLNRNVLEAALGSWRQMTDESVKKTINRIGLLHFDNAYPGFLDGLGKM